MNKRILSYLLLLLFGLVIIFPGYGNTRSPQNSGNASCIIKEKEASMPAQILLQCFSNGINMLEEEQASEEDDHQGVTDYLSPDAIRINNKSGIPVNGNVPGMISESVYFKGVFAPPEW